MPSIEALAAFALASLIIVVIPGPSVLFVVGRALAVGRRGGLMTVLGNELGGLVLIAAVALGVGTLVAESILVFTAIKLVGAAYLVYLGVQAIRHRRDGMGMDPGNGRDSVSALVTLRQGFVVGVTNPKTIVFFVAVLPQFVDFHAGGLAVQMVVLGIVFTLIAFMCDSAWALVADAARTWFGSSPRRLARTRATGGAMMIGLGGALALTGQKA
jgi:threonine/homoserine/homoserine lactone efflux protein